MSYIECPRPDILKKPDQTSQKTVRDGFDQIHCHIDPLQLCPANSWFNAICEASTLGIGLSSRLQAGGYSEVDLRAQIEEKKKSGQ